MNPGAVGSNPAADTTACAAAGEKRADLGLIADRYFTLTSNARWPIGLSTNSGGFLCGHGAKPWPAIESLGAEFIGRSSAWRFEGVRMRVALPMGGAAAMKRP